MAENVLKGALIGGLLDQVMLSWPQLAAPTEPLSHCSCSKEKIGKAGERKFMNCSKIREVIHQFLSQAKQPLWGSTCFSMGLWKFFPAFHPSYLIFPFHHDYLATLTSRFALELLWQKAYPSAMVSLWMCLLCQAVPCTALVQLFPHSLFLGIFYPLLKMFSQRCHQLGWRTQLCLSRSIWVSHIYRTRYSVN